MFSLIFHTKMRGNLFLKAFGVSFNITWGHKPKHCIWSVSQYYKGSQVKRLLTVDPVPSHLWCKVAVVQTFYFTFDIWSSCESMAYSRCLYSWRAAFKFFSKPNERWILTSPCFFIFPHFSKLHQTVCPAARIFYMERI